MPIGARGEGYVEYEGERKPVLFTNRALAEAEQVLGKSVVSLVRYNTPGFDDTIKLLAIGMEHGRRDAKEARRSYTVNDAVAVMDQMGYSQVVLIIVEAIAAVISYKAGEKDESDPPV